MKMSQAIEGFRSDVAAVGELGDEAVVEVTERIAAVLTRSASSRILDLLSEAMAELSSELPEGRIEIRLVGNDVKFAYVDDGAMHEPEAELSSRVTLRLSDQLKARVEESAGRNGLSVNSWILRTLERATSATKVRSSRGGSRLRGYGTS